MGWRDIGEPGARLAPLARCHVKAIAVHWNRDQAGASANQGAARAVVAGILDPRWVAGV
jgi:hypothetical protein